MRGVAMAGTGIVVRADGEGEKRWFYGGGLHTWKATAEETNGAFLLFEDHIGGGQDDALPHPPLRRRGVLRARRRDHGARRGRGGALHPARRLRFGAAGHSTRLHGH